MAPNVDQSGKFEGEVQEAIHAGQKLASAPMGEEICITGISGKFPDSDSVDELKENLFNKRDLVTADQRRWTLVHPEIPARTGKLNNISQFDAAFFGIHSRQAHSIDPACRILLEKTCEAILDAGMNPEELRGTKTGVFVGACFSESEKTWFYEKLPEYGFGITGSSRPMLANRVAYWLGTIGPSYTVDTACSSSLYALDHAYKAIRDGVCDQAIVGGANLCLNPYISLQFKRLGVLSLEGRCRTFDREGNGYVRSEAIGALLVQKSRDARRIYAKVVHSKINCDGYKSQGITYPSGDMQQKLLEEFYQECKVDPRSVSWVEAHGTGTKVGDPEELNALDAVFCKGRKTPLPIGSVKSNLGHSEPSSGLCSISKVIIAMETLYIPPNLHFKVPREEVPPLVNGNLQVVTEPQPWNGGLVGVNSFGFGGANCHVLLDWNHKKKINGGRPSDNIPRLVTISSRTEKGLQQILNDLESRPIDAEYVNLYHKIHSINIPGHAYRGYTLLKQGQPSRHMQIFSGARPPVWFVLSGLDSQWTGMGKSLLILPSFDAAITRCHKTLKPVGLDLKKILMDDTFDNVIHTLVGITAIQIGLVDVLRTVGIYPDGLIGLSIGELAAGYVDGCLTLEQTIQAAYYQGLSLLELDSAKGSMASIGVGSKEAQALLPQDIEVAFKSGSGSCIISGPSNSVAMFLKSLSGKGIVTKEIKCNNIAVHSRYIKGVGSKLIKYLQKVIPSPKSRSKQWISTSFPKSVWTSQSAMLASAEYLAHSLLSPVLFDSARAHVPSNALVIEIAPDATLHTTLSKLGAACVSLMDSHRDSTEHLLLTLGKLFEYGLQPQLAELYPSVLYPVSRTTPMISQLIDWQHLHDWHVTKYDPVNQFKSGEMDVSINVAHEDMTFYTGHVIDGRNLFPATGYLVLVWESLARMNDCAYDETSIVFEKVRFHRATNIPKDGKVMFVVLIQKGSGNFEVVEGGSAIVTGRVYVTENPDEEMFKLPSLLPARGTDIIDLSSKDVYKELRLRGYNYSGLFRSIVSADNLGRTGKICWKDNWVAFMDNMLQMQILMADTRGLFVPTAINKLIINTPEHLSMVQATGDEDEKVLDVFVHHEVGVIRSGGIEIHGLKASAISRRKPLGDPVIEKYLFMPNTNSVCKENTPRNVLEALHVCIHLILENQMGIKVKAVELVDSHTNTEKKMAVLAPGVAAVLGDLPLIQADITVLADANNPLVVDLDSTIKVEDKKLASEENVLFVIGTNMMGRDDVLQAALGCVGTTGYLISREKPNTPLIQGTGIHIINEYNLDDEKLVLIKKEGTVQKSTVIHIQEGTFEWIPKLQATLKDEKSLQNILLVSQNEATSGLLGLFNCLRKEPGGENIRCFLILDKTAPKFSLALPFYQDQIKKDVAVNVFKNGEWGSFRHVVLEPCAMVSAKHAYLNIETRGDLSTFHWFEGSLDPDCYKPKQHERVVHVYYSALNFRDVMCSTGKLATEVLEQNRIRQQNVLGLEFSGIDLNGKRVMGQFGSGGMANMVVADTSLLWEVPDEWSLEDAATVPVVYATACYALNLAGKMKKGDSVLIHAGSGGVGQAAIHLALHEGCTVYTTVGTREKRDFIKQMFPQLTDRNIGNSRDTSFEQLVMTETKGRGVDLVLNSLSEEKLQASVRCLAVGGRFLEIGKIDIVNNNPLGMDIFLKETSFHGIMLDLLLAGRAEWKKPLYDIIAKGIKDGAVKPLTRTVFNDDEVEKAFRFMAAGKHIGKVLLKIREEEKDVSLPPSVLYHQAKPQVCCNPDCTYIIAGGLGGFGLELADWLVLRGAGKLVLTSRSGLRTGYQSSRVRVWRSYGVTVQISTEDVTTEMGVTTLLTEANKLGPVAGIFNLAVVLLDGLFENQTEDNFRKSFCPKAEATKHLDVISRKLCPQLKYFVIFSSVSCGRGNAGQTNYGMANSVMERICEQRVLEGYPGVAMQWGAVGDVGLVADMQEEEHELVIGGTLQQRISSCLQVLDGFLRQSHPVVASMVVAEKKVGSGGSGNIVDCIANIIGLRDLKTISMHTTLAELGMDSMMAVEIKQTLEREFEMLLTPQDVRGLTFAKLIDFANSDDAASKESVNVGNFDGLQFLFRALGDEKDVSQPVVILPSITDANMPPTDLFLIPGIEGMAFHFESLAKNLKFKVNALQLGHWTDNLSEKVSEMASLLLPFVQKSLKSIKEPFQLLGHSFGGLVAMHLALKLEEAGYQGKIVLVDSSPDFIRDVIKFQIGADGNDDNLQTNLLVLILNLVKNQETAFFKQAHSELAKLQSWDERVEHFLTLIPESQYSHKYRKSVAHSTLRRIRATTSFDWPEGIKLKSSVTLIRPTVQAIQTSEDYGLRKYFEGSVEVYLVEGDHSTVLDNPLVAQIVNTQMATSVEEFNQKDSKVQK